MVLNCFRNTKLHIYYDKFYPKIGGLGKISIKIHVLVDYFAKDLQL